MRLIFILFLIFISCGTDEKIVPEHKILAKVNGEILSQDELDAVLNGASDLLDKKDIARQYTKRWIHNAILAQEAKRLGYGLSKDEQFHIKNLEKDYLINKYLQTNRDKIDVSALDVRNYYDSRKDEFKRLDDEYHLIHLFLPQRIRAVQNEIFASKDILAVIKKFHLSKTVNEQLLNGDLGIVQGFQLSKRLKDRIDKATIDRIYGPIRITGGYHYFQLKEKFEKGTFLPIERVRDAIKERLFLQKLEQAKHDVIEGLKANYSIESKY